MPVSKHTAVYEMFCLLCSAYEFPEPLRFLTSAPNAYRCPADPQVAITTLSAHFPVDALLESRIAQRSAAGALELAAALADPQGGFIALKGGQERRVFDLLTDSGCLSGCRLPVLAVLDDALTAAALSRRTEGELFVCARLADAIMLRVFGFPVATTAGLDRLSRDDLLALATRFALLPANVVINDLLYPESAAAAHPPTADPEHAEHQCPPAPPVHSGPTGPGGSDPADRWYAVGDYPLTELSLVFVGWSPTLRTAEAPAELRAVMDALTELLRFADVARELRFAVWRPAEELYVRLAFGVDRRTPEWIQAALDASDGNFLGLPEPPRPVEPVPPADFGEAMSQFLDPTRNRAGASPEMAGQSSQLSDALLLTLDRDLIGPIVQAAMHTRDPLERNLLVVLADLSRLFHQQGLVLAKHTAKALAAEAGLAQALQLQKPVATLLAVSGRIESLSRRIHECRKTSKQTAAERRPLSAFQRMGSFSRS